MLNTLKLIRQSVKCLTNRHRFNNLLTSKSTVDLILTRYKYSSSTGVKGIKNKKYKIENNTDEDDVADETNEYDVNEEDKYDDIYYLILVS